MAGPVEVTVWYDGDCPLRRNEIAVLRALDGGGKVAFVDLSIAEPFAAVWRAVPPLPPLGEMARSPRVLARLERLYLGFLKIRPWLQALLSGPRRPDHGDRGRDRART
ncbi:MAG TPA: DUF393 domain-containing protein [Phenylobacterium sp.]|nr:DUF393 domain-containing protein [Phenylobacterium sp.]